MKKIRFLANVHDKYTQEKYVKGQEKEFNNERANEILKTKYAELVEEAETATKKVKVETAVKKTRRVKSIEIDLDKGTVKENDV